MEREKLYTGLKNYPKTPVSELLVTKIALALGLGKLFTFESLCLKLGHPYERSRQSLNCYTIIISVERCSNVMN